MQNSLKRIFAAICALSVGLSAFADGYVKREVRSVWMATVWALDWPSTTGTSAMAQKNQKEEMVKYLDQLKADNFNTLYFQVRSMCDAFYRSSYEPWSSYLTGTRGADPGWDPLEFVVEECHKRGMECHAWVNPYRWTTSTQWSTEQDLALQEAGLLLEYDGTIILNPGLPAARQRIVDVCEEIATNYDVDGIVFDDYFYPNGIPSNSSAGDYELWQSSGSGMTIGDWRRANVNQMVADVYNMIQRVKPYVKFGISPAGVACSDASVAAKHGVERCPVGSDWQYNGIFSDPVAWLEEGTIDYISPQLYWKTTHSTNPFGPLTRWWSKVASQFGRHHYASHSISFLSDSNTQSDWEEVGRQVQYTRDYDLDAAPGQVYYSANKITGKSRSGLGEWLLANKYQRPALVPAIDWKTAASQGLVQNLTKTGLSLSWDAVDNVRYTVYAIPNGKTYDEVQSTVSGGIMADYLLDMTYDNAFTIPDDYRVGYYFAVCVLDRYGNEYPPKYTNDSGMPAEKVTLQSPADGAGVKLEAAFKWTAAQDASYVLEVASDAEFENMAYCSDVLKANELTLDVTDWARGRTFYWRVTTSQAGRYDVASDVASFTTVDYDPAGSAALISPANGSEVGGSAGVDFAWEAVEGCSYRLEVASDAAMERIVFSRSAGGTSLSVPMADLGYSSTLYWRVTTERRGHTPSVSETWSFTTPTLPAAPATTIYAPESGASLNNNFFVEFKEVDADGYVMQMSRTDGFSDIVYTLTSGWEIAGGVVRAALPVNLLPEGTYYWRVSVKKEGCMDTFTETRALTLSNSVDADSDLGDEEGYRPVQDGAAYPVSGTLQLVNLWTRSAKSGYENMEFESDGSLNRSFCVQDGVIYIAGRSENSSFAECYLDKYSALTGAKIGRVYLSDNVCGSYYPCNDVMKDAVGNIVVSNLTLNVATTPLRLWKVNVSTGAAELAAECQATALAGGRVDHCSIYGDLSTGSFTVFAPVSGSNTVVVWTYSGGSQTEERVVSLDGFYPAAVGDFGIAPRVYPYASNVAFVNGGSIAPMRFAVKSDDTDTFSGGDAAPSGFKSNGFATFNFDNNYYAVYPDGDDTTPSGFSFCVASTNSSRSLSAAEPLWTIPETGLGSVFSTTGDALADYETYRAGRSFRSAHIYVYVPGNGLAAYALFNRPQSGVEETELGEYGFTVAYADGTVRASRMADRIEVYSLSGALVASAGDTAEMPFAAVGGVYVVRAVAADGAVTAAKIVVR